MPTLTDSTKPKYVQIKERVKDGILRGEWRVGDQLPTCRELTEQFDVAPMTVWKALDELVNEDLVRRVRGKGSFVSESPAAAEQLLGLIMRPEGDVFGTIYHQLLNQFGALGRHVISTDIGDHDVPEVQRQGLLHRFLDRKLNSLVVDGRTFLPFPLLRDWHQGARQLTFILRHETTLPFPKANRILADWEAGGRLAAEHLLADHGKRLLLVTHAYPGAAEPSLGPRQQFHWDVIRGIETALREAGLAKTSLRIVLDTPLANPDDAILQALRDGFDRVFCLGDFRAPRVYRQAASEGMQIGTDVRICGFCNTHWAPLLYPALTSVNIHEERLAATAVEAVNENWQGEHIDVPPTLHVRASSQPGGIA